MASGKNKAVTAGQLHMWNSIKGQTLLPHCRTADADFCLLHFTPNQTVIQVPLCEHTNAYQFVRMNKKDITLQAPECKAPVMSN